MQLPMRSYRNRDKRKERPLHLFHREKYGYSNLDSSIPKRYRFSLFPRAPSPHVFGYSIDTTYFFPLPSYSSSNFSSLSCSCCFCIGATTTRLLFLNSERKNIHKISSTCKGIPKRNIIQSGPRFAPTPLSLQTIRTVKKAQVSTVQIRVEMEMKFSVLYLQMLA